MNKGSAQGALGMIESQHPEYPTFSGCLTPNGSKPPCRVILPLPCSNLDVYIFVFRKSQNQPMLPAADLLASV